MNKHAKILFIFAIFGLLLVGVLLLRGKTGQNSNSQLPTTPETINDNSNNISSTSFIEGLRKREYKSSQITVESTLSNNGSYTGYLISYLSDGLKIYGRMNIPTGDTPANGFPIIILNHGYFNTSSFTSGDGTQNMADILARNGYVTLASDYRSHGKSDSDGQREGHRPEYSIDVLNLIAAVNTIEEKADVNRIGMWGHSMGGEVTLRAIEATDAVRAVVLWAPTSANAADNHAFYGGSRNTPQDISAEIDGTSPINYLTYISAAISIHQGLVDTEVKPEWSKQLNDALKEEGKASEYFEYPGQDHNFRNLGWDVISKRTIDFFDRYLK